jgi:lipoic acid synthetase
MENIEINSESQPPLDLHRNKPEWLKTSIPTGKIYFDIKKDLRSRKLVTVCEEAKCPNIGKCWNTNTATFMILGDTCTRGCRFCNVKTGNPNGILDLSEPLNVAESVKLMNLKYVVVTMVDRDDLPDGGAQHVAQVLSEVTRLSPGIKIELLAGDFKGSKEALDVILQARPDVYAHNIETIKRLTPRVRDPRASYTQSLEALELAKKLAPYPLYTKSAVMLGLGETKEEVFEALQDLRDHDVDFITIGQYMRPTKKHLSIKRWAHPDEFLEISEKAKELGFRGVASAPLVRSSYMAREFYENATGQTL